MAYYRPLPNFLTIRKSKIEGLGIFTTETIEKDTVLGISHIKDEHRLNLDGWSRTPLGGFYNYSEKPNCKTRKIDGIYFELVTLKKIESGEEITAKYSSYDPTLK